MTALGPLETVDDEWLDGSFYAVGKTVLLGPDGWRGHLAFDPGRKREREVCREARLDGDTCRLPEGHEGKHLAFSGELVATTGVMVTAFGVDAAPT